MTVHLYYKPGYQHQLDAMTLLSEGLMRHDLVSNIAPDWNLPADCEFVVCWGDKVPEGIRVPRLLLEAGYINGQSGHYVQDRLRFVSAGWNGLHGRADPVRFDCPPDRLRGLHLKVSPWRAKGKYILVCDNHPGDAVSGPAKWWHELESLYPLPAIRYRPHPLLKPDQEPLHEALAGAALCVTWSSTSAIESVLRGVPTVAMSESSVAWPVTSHALKDDIFVGDREPWLRELSYRQWTPDELADGTAWEYLRHGL